MSVQNNMDLEEEITLLKKENEKLKERLDIMKATASTHIQDINEVRQDYGDMVRELKKENEELKDGENTAKMIDKLNKEFSVLMDKNIKLEEENKKLKEDIKTYKDMYDKLQWEVSGTFSHTDYEDDIIRDGYTKLDAVVEWMCAREEQISDLQEENKKLEEEIKELKKENTFARRRRMPFGWTIDSIKNLQEERDELKEENREEYCEIVKLQGENEKLKEIQKINDDDINKLEKLREAVRKELDVEPDPTQETIINTIKSLKGENEKLRENAELSKEFWSCLMDCRGNPDNPDKSEIDEWCDAYNKSDKIRDYLTKDLE